MLNLKCVTYHSKLKSQALLELTVFGAIIIMLLGVLINYGLRYNFQVKAMQDAFRKALEYAYYSANPGLRDFTPEEEARCKSAEAAYNSVKSKYDGKHGFFADSIKKAFKNAYNSACSKSKKKVPTSVSYLLIKDKHIPSPSNPFGIGPVIPVSASAGVTRDSHSQDTASYVEELPRLAVDIEGSTCPKSHDCPSGGCQPPCTYLTAGFREFNNVHTDYIDKYIEIFGQTPEGCTAFDGADNCIDGAWAVLPYDLTCTEQDCDLREVGIILSGVPGTEIYSEGGDTDPVITGYEKYTINKIRVIDSCEGEIIDYNTAIQQCRKMTDSEYCTKECEKGQSPGDTRNCDVLCEYPIAPAWYCNFIERDKITGKYIFRPNTENGRLFPVGRKNMGLQANYEKNINNIDENGKIIDNVFRKDETLSSITTKEEVNWKETTKRHIVLRPFFGNKGDEDAKFTDEVIESIYEPYNKGKTKTMETKW